jgi:xylan 1,4-beta-xylosidase
MLLRSIPLRLTASCIFVALAALCPARPSYSNPIIPGDWSDPGMIRVGEDFYSLRSTFGWQPGLAIAHSTNLIDWRYLGYAMIDHEKIAPGDTRNGIWGSEIGFNPNTRQFLIYAPTRDHEIYVFSSDRPEGPYEMRSLGAGLGIDPGFFADDDGRLYLIVSKGQIFELESDGLSIKRQAAQIDRSGYAFFEGPAIFKRAGWYYALFSDGGTLPGEASTISVLRAPAITGPWEEDPNNPVMFASDVGAEFEGPAHGTLIEMPDGQWYVTFHAHEIAYYTLGRQTLMQPIEWTEDGWWRPTTGKIPTLTGPAPDLPASDFRLAQSDAFDDPRLGLQWFFHTKPDFSGEAWTLSEGPGVLRIRTQPGHLSDTRSLPGVFLQRVIDKRFSFETTVTFAAREGREAAGLHLYHDPHMNLWLTTTVRDGEPRIEVGRHNLNEREDLWSVPNPHGDTVHLRVEVDGEESATFHFSGDGESWERIGESLYFGASGHHLRDGRRGAPDLGWVGLYKDPKAPPELSQVTADPYLPHRRGNTWTAATFGVFAVRDGASSSRPADFSHFTVTK